jgi:hypothetical protein
MHDSVANVKDNNNPTLVQLLSLVYLKRNFETVDQGPIEPNKQ